jgi:hypothetical protein
MLRRKMGSTPKIHSRQSNDMSPGINASNMQRESQNSEAAGRQAHHHEPGTFDPRFWTAHLSYRTWSNHQHGAQELTGAMSGTRAVQQQ